MKFKFLLYALSIFLLLSPTKALADPHEQHRSRVVVHDQRAFGPSELAQRIFGESSTPDRKSVV